VVRQAATQDEDENLVDDQGTQKREQK